MAGKHQNQLFALSPRDLNHVLSVAATDLMALRGRSVFVTGGTGFFGKWLLAVLMQAEAELELGLRVTVLSRDPEAFQTQYPEVRNQRAFGFVRGNVATFSADVGPIEHIIHAGADTTAFTAQAEEQERSRTIIEGTRRIIDLAQMKEARLLFVSSGAVYGPVINTSGAREDDVDPERTLTPYGAAKLQAEMMCTESGVNFSSARAFAFLGPYLPLEAHFAAGNFLRDALQGGPVLVRGDGTALRSYLHPADLIVWLLRILVRGGCGRAYNVGSDEAVTTARLARAIASAVQPKPKVMIQSVEPHGPQNIYVPDISRARSELDLDVTIPLDDAIARTIEFLKLGRTKP